METMKKRLKQKRRYDFGGASRTKKCVKDGEMTSSSKRSSKKMERLRRRRCRLGEFTDAEFDGVLRCTAPWKACGIDSVYSFLIKKCPTLKKVVYVLVKKNS